MTTTCPVCSVASRAGRECTGCGTDLSILDGIEGLGVRYYNEALAAAKAGREEEALRLADAAVGIDPGHAASWLVKGKLLAQAGRYNEAREALERAQTTGSEDAVIQEKTGKAMARIGEILDEQNRKREEEEETAARRRQRNAGLLAAVAVLATVAVVRLPPSTFTAARAVQLALDGSRTTAGRHVTAAPADSAVALRGTLNSPLEAALVESIAARAAGGRRIDVSGLRMSDTYIAAELGRITATLPAVLRAHVPGAGQDILDAMSHVKLTAAADAGGGVRLAGTVPMAELKPLLMEMAAGIASRPVDVSDVKVADEYIEYTIREGDAPESIARRMCGTARRLEGIRTFSAQNARTLDEMRIGSVVRIPRRLLAHGQAAVRERTK